MVIRTGTSLRRRVPIAALPFLIIADASGSMAEDRKIEALNEGIRALVTTLAGRFGPDAAVAAVTFGGPGAVLHLSPTPAPDVAWPDVAASGGTPLGAALRLAAQVLDHPGFVSPDGMRPVVLLAADGRPMPGWRSDYAAFAAHTLGGLSERWALALGADADLDMLDEFATTPWAPAPPQQAVCFAATAPEIVAALRMLPMRLGAPGWRDGEDPPDTEPDFASWDW
jgi:uncharacterized protein YegL